MLVEHTVIKTRLNLTRLDGGCRVDTTGIVETTQQEQPYDTQLISHVTTVVKQGRTAARHVGNWIEIKGVMDTQI